MNLENFKISIIGLGYVGLPLAYEFGKKINTIGFDINSTRVNELNNSIDKTLEIENSELDSVLKNGLLSITNEPKKIKDSNVFIITVPTPIDKQNKPNIGPLISASTTVGKYLKKGDIVIYESTVYPGATEEDCVPILEKESNLKFNIDFFVGYSPERINPGDKIHSLTTIVKVTSGSNEETSKTVDFLYSQIIDAGTFKATSIKVAEAAKVIENTQRDLNIAFVNELSKIFSLMNINTMDVLDAASTKWNFLKFKPGLVGGHCIGVDPYYLAEKSIKLGYNPDVILSGRKINDEMSKHVAYELLQLLISKNINSINSKCLILGFTFKENCPDFRNTKVADVFLELKKFKIDCTVYDPWVDSNLVLNEYGINVLNDMSQLEKYDSIILAVAHKDFENFKFKKYLNDINVIYDLKSVVKSVKVDKSL
jgi:UDP-N-acetyl-D-glucosamine/UDP-N-acetyl-D-galactosamine dehydrogenase